MATRDTILCMAHDQHRDNLLTAVALAEFSYRRERTNPGLARRSWQLAINRLAEYGMDPYEAVDALQAIDKGETIDVQKIENIRR